MVVVNESVVDGSADSLLREIKALEPTLPVVWIANADVPSALSESVPDAMLKEPVSVAALGEVVAKILREHFLSVELGR